MGGGMTHLKRFVPAITDYRPDWKVKIYSSQEIGDLFEGICEVELIAGKLRSRFLWDAFGVALEAKRTHADVILNLANFGPINSKIPSIMYQRNSLYFDRHWYKQAGGKFRITGLAKRNLAFLEMRNSSAVIVPSKAMEGYLRDGRGFPRRQNVRIIPHAVDHQSFHPSKQEHDEKIRFVSLSLAAPHKNQRLLVPVISQLIKKGFDISLEATIEDSDAPEYVSILRSDINAEGLQDRFKIVGKIDASLFLENATAMIIPSESESFCFPVIEAMASGVPVIASSIASITELLGDCGWYFKPGDSESACNAIIKFLNTPKEDIEMKVAAGLERSKEFTWTRNVESVAKLIEEMVSIRKK